MSLAHLAEIFQKEDRHFDKEADGSLRFIITKRQGDYTVILDEPEVGWVLAQVFIACEGLDDFELLQQEIEIHYKGLIGVQLYPPDAPTELIICSYLLPTAVEAGLKYFTDSCDDLHPFLQQAAEQGVWDLKDFQCAVFKAQLKLN